MAKETVQKNNETKAEPRRSRLSGVVVSAKMKDTVVVRVDRYVKHPKYHKFMTRSTRIKAHDAGNAAKEGDKVTIESCRPMSRDKHFIIVK